MVNKVHVVQNGFNLGEADRALRGEYFKVPLRWPVHTFQGYKSLPPEILDAHHQVHICRLKSKRFKLGDS